MTGRHWSTPFGARPLAAAPMLAEITLRARQAALTHASGEAGGEGANGENRVADKWQLLRALTEARARFGLSDRTIGVLDALLSFHPGKAIDGAAPAIVFPSNRELSLRSRGMAPATLRRHLAALVEAGFVLRRDSPNGKRFRRLGADGEGMEVFGLDLSPLALASGAIFEAAEAERRIAHEARSLRTAISIHRRDVAKVVEAALAESRPGPWDGFAACLAAIGAGGRGAGVPELRNAEAQLLRLRAEAETAYLDALTAEEMSANDAENERHHQNSKPDPLIESKGRDEREGSEAGRRPAEAKGADTGSGGEPCEGRGAFERKALDIAAVLAVCPDIAAYGKAPPRDWREFIALADLVRGFLGVSRDAWADARDAMGEAEAAVVIACILQRSERIRSAGGYLRDLTGKAKRGRFSVHPMLRALRGE